MTERKAARYTHFPRTILWLVPGSEGSPGEPSAAGQEQAARGVEPFYISKFPITNEQFQAFDPGYLPAESSPGSRDPAVEVSYEEALAYCRWYAEISRKPMRLPTETEWEHACRGGGDGGCGEEAEALGWDAENSGGRLGPLEAKRANGYGLYGMLGGVWEWVRPADPALEEGRAVLRGGSFLTPGREINCSLRRLETRGARFPDAGFRIVKNLRRDQEER